MGKFFGTDGVRGIANGELTAEVAHKIGIAFVNIFFVGKSNKAKILLGKDTRISCDMLEGAVIG